MTTIHIKTDERRAAEAQSLREFGIDPYRATAEQREFAERITYDNKVAAKEFARMEDKSR